MVDRLMRAEKWAWGMFTILFSLSAGCAQSVPSMRALTPAEERPPRIEVRDFILGPADEIEVFVWQHPDLSRTAVVNPAGFISYPLVGTLRASGLTGEELATQITKGLSKYVVDPQVTVAVKTARSRKIFVLGEVNRAGVFPMEGPIRAVEAIALAEGFNQDAKPKSVLLIRGDLRQPELHVLSLHRTLLQGAVAENIWLQPGDIIYVPTTPIASVERFFRRISSILIPFVATFQSAIFFQAVQ